ncbi:SWIM zinc finger family protein [Streptomyces glaucescens]|uniref:SWIM zinc finger family protein n=1 Tax=Streptomyces glaucescens TaxID=1907 RepID=UPI000A391E16|nr:SWIM zinc finger family protein [Streptomyces glaucescens]
MSGDETGARGFPAFAARRGSRARGQSWWGKAWADALEDTSLEEDALKKGRAYARTGRLGPITVSPGRISTTGYEDDTPFKTVLTLEQLDEDDWESLWEKTAERPDVVEELLAGELPPDLLEAAEDARVRLLPGYGDLEADCDCDAFDHPCKHAAALCYQASWLLDEDAMLLLLLRGRGAQEAQEELRSVLLMQAIIGGLGDEDEDEDEDDADDGAANDEAQQEETRAAAVQLPDGTPAEEVFGRAPAPLPELPPLPGPPPGQDASATGVGADPLEQLVTTAAVRARELLAYTHGFTAEPSAPLDLWRDCVRIAATRPGAQVLARLREACGSPQQLDRAAEAWRLGGSAGLDVLEEAWTPPQADIARARTALTAGWEHNELPELEVRDNRWTLAGTGLQLRYGRDGRWYPYRQQDGRWWPAAAPHHDPAEVLAELLDG